MTQASSTTKENYDLRVHGPPGSTSNAVESGSGWRFGQNLSNLFIDVGTVAVSLDIQYVWIDSICIIQQNTADWEYEANMMTAYYQNAWLTVAATKTVTKRGGFLHQAPLNPSSIPRVSRLPYRNREGKQQGHFYLQGLPFSTLRQEFEDNVNNSDLLNRGWAFQEWILSPRILCFSTLMPFLVCAELPPLPIAGNMMTNNAIDSVQSRRDNSQIEDYFSDGETGFSEQGYKHRLGLDLTASRASVFNSWRNLMMIYSSLELTRFENDRLVALAGVAKEFGMALSAKPIEPPGEVRTNNRARYSNTFACGIWLGDIVQELQWERSEGLRKPPCRTRGFPTWSWLSLGSPTLDEAGQPALGGAKVQWPDFNVSKSQSPGFFFSLKVRALPDSLACVSLKSAYIIPVGTEPDGWHVDLSQSKEWKGLEPLGQLNDYGNKNRFVGLYFEQAKYIDVRVTTRFDSERHSSIAAKCTDHRSDVQRDHWRAVTLPISGKEERGAQNTIQGWASLEHPQYQRTGQDPKEDRVLALRIAVLPEVQMGGQLMSFSDTAAIVLYIRQVGRGETGDRTFFERLGVGRLFGSDIESRFDAAEEKEIWLI